MKTPIKRTHQFPNSDYIVWLLLCFFGCMTAFTSCTKEPDQIQISLCPDRYEIFADGQESVTFSVIDDKGEDVTFMAEIYCKTAGENGTDSVGYEKLSGQKYCTNTAGTYWFYAEYRGVKSNVISITANNPAPVEPPKEGTSVVFVEGVTKELGWYDVNKMGDGTINGDINMCWAAASANMIQWWQDRYVAAGGKLPVGAVTGEGKVQYEGVARKYELALMDMYHSEWNNSKGCHTAEAIPWYFEGVNYGETATAGSQAYPLTAGGYWKDIWSTIYPNLYHEYTYMLGMYKNMYTSEYTAYEHWGNGSSLTGVARHKKFSDIIVEFIGRGIASMAVTLNANGGLNHATTVWGYEIDNSSGLVTKLWITDSDDLIAEPKTQKLNEYQVLYNTGDKFITLTSSSVRYGKIYVISLNPFSGYRND